MRNRFFAIFALNLVFAFIACTVSVAAPPSGDIVGPFPKVGEYEVLRGDFHLHTVSSDGKLTTRERVEDAKERGLDALAIADHGNFRSLRFETQYAPTRGMVAVPGMETGLRGGMSFHLVALGFDPVFKSVNSHNWSQEPGGKTVYYRDQMREVQKAGGLLVMAHSHPESLCEPMLWGIQQGIIQGIEVHTAKRFNADGFDWALKYNLAVFADSDAHASGTGIPNYTLVFVKQKSAEGVMDAIKGRRTVALYDGVFWGRQDILSTLVNALVKVRLVEENGSICAAFENTGPVAMKGVIAGSSEKPIEIGANSRTRIPWTGGKTLSIKWDNAYVSSKDKLSTTFKIGG